MNFKKIIFTFSLMLCILLCISCIAAEDVNDTVVAGDVGDVEIASSDDNQVIEQTNDDIIAESGNGNFTELQARILLAPDGSTINLDKNYSYNVNSKITTGVLINKNLVIDGKGHTIDGMSKTRIFTIFYGLENNNNVVLKNIVFKNAYTNGYGGAILSFANLTVDNCTFINNYANIAGGAINSLGGLNLKNSKFDKNVAGGDAGAVFSLNIKYSFKIFKSLNISQNNTYGADFMFPIMMNISLEHCKDYISNCIFTNNVANGNGGGEVYAFSHIDVASSTFNSNKAGEKGAAVFG